MSRAAFQRSMGAMPSIRKLMYNYVQALRALAKQGSFPNAAIWPYRSGRVRSWIKVKNPASPAMLRIIEEGAW